jgi:methionyl-tRNA formyltransferase
MKLKELKIIFFGTSFFAKEILRNLLDNDVNIDLVITQPDRPAGRKKYFRPTDVKSLALERGIETKEFEKIKQEEINFIKNANPDLIITASYGLIIPKEILEIPKYGSVNIHPSLLPELRGSSPIQAALLQNLPETGISFMKMNEKMDAGPVFFQKKLKIDKEDVYPTLAKSC